MAEEMSQGKFEARFRFGCEADGWSAGPFEGLVELFEHRYLFPGIDPNPREIVFWHGVADVACEDRIVDELMRRKPGSFVEVIFGNGHVAQAIPLCSFSHRERHSEYALVALVGTTGL